MTNKSMTEEECKELVKLIHSILDLLNETDCSSAGKVAALMESLRISHAAFRGEEINASEFHDKIGLCIFSNFPINNNGEDSCTNSTETNQ